MPLSCSAVWTGRLGSSHGAALDARTKYEEHCVKVPFCDKHVSLFSFLSCPQKVALEMRKLCEFLKVQVDKKKTIESIKENWPLRVTLLLPLLCVMSPAAPTSLSWHSHHRQDPTKCSAMATQDGTEVSALGKRCGNLPHVWRAGAEVALTVNYKQCSHFLRPLVPGSPCQGMPNHWWHGSKLWCLGSALHSKMNSHTPDMSLSQGFPGLCLGLLWSQVREEHGCEPAAAQGGAPEVPLPLRWCRKQCQLATDLQHHMWAKSTLHNLETRKYLWSWSERYNIQKHVSHKRGRSPLYTLLSRKFIPFPNSSCGCCWSHAHTDTEKFF